MCDAGAREAPVKCGRSAPCVRSRDACIVPDRSPATGDLPPMIVLIVSAWPVARALGVVVSCAPRSCAWWWWVL
jgi:hypothetical protein